MQRPDEPGRFLESTERPGSFAWWSDRERTARRLHREQRAYVELDAVTSCWILRRLADRYERRRPASSRTSRRILDRVPRSWDYDLAG